MDETRTKMKLSTRSIDLEGSRGPNSDPKISKFLTPPGPQIYIPKHAAILRANGTHQFAKRCRRPTLFAHGVPRKLQTLMADTHGQTPLLRVQSP